MTCEFINQALYSGKFLDYDFQTNTYKNSLLRDAVFKLKSNIINLQKMEEVFDNKRRMEFIERFKHSPRTDAPILVDNFDLLLPISILNLQENIIKLSMGLLRAFNGKEDYLKKVELNPLSPLMNQSEEKGIECPSNDEIKSWSIN